MDGQTVVIEDYLSIRPEAAERLDRAVARGQIEVGPWYTLPDEFLVSGEALVRNLDRGIALGDAHGGSMRVGYLPDSFGHAAQMPQIYRQFGFRHAAVWRGVPSSVDRLAFAWESPDGSHILSAYMGTSYSHGVDLPVEGAALAARLRAALEALEPFRPGADVLLMNGNDHVHPQQALSRAVHDAGAHMEGIEVRLAGLRDYLERLPEAGWPHWQGELRASSRANVLMGTLSVRVSDKQAYFAAGLALERFAEPLAALSGLDAGGLLREAWTLILQNAAHDTACGSGVDVVADESRVRSRSALQLAEAVSDRAAASLVEPAGQTVEGLMVWNPSAFTRQDLVEAAFETVPDGGQDLGPAPAFMPTAYRFPTNPSRRPLRRGLVPSGLINGCAVGRLPSRIQGQAPVKVEDGILENGLLRCRVESDGSLAVEELQLGRRFPGLHQLVDEADAGDEYNFSPPPGGPHPVIQAEKVVDVRELEGGPLRAKLEVRSLYRVPRELSPDRLRRDTTTADLPVTIQLSLRAGSPQLDFDVSLVNQAKDHRLRVHFPLPFQPARSHADSAYHVTPRAAVAARHEPGAPEWELPTYPMRTFVDVSDGAVGVALITAGLHEYELVPGPPSFLALTLLRAVGWLSRDDLAYRNGHAGPPLPTPGAQVLGEHRFRYSLRFHAGDWEKATIWRAAESTLLPLRVLLPAGSLRGAHRSITLEPETLQMTALIPRDYGYDLRLLNVSEEAQDCAVRIEPLPFEVTWVSLGGEVREQLSARKGVFHLALRQWEIATLRVRREGLGA